MMCFYDCVSGVIFFEKRRTVKFVPFTTMFCLLPASLLGSLALSGCVFDKVELSKKLECQGSAECETGQVCACSQCVVLSEVGEACGSEMSVDGGQSEDVGDVMVGDTAPTCVETGCVAGERCDEGTGVCVEVGCQGNFDCEDGGQCIDGVCGSPTFCEAGVSVCDADAEAILLCSDDGGTWLRELCGEGALCVENEDGATCQTEVPCEGRAGPLCRGGEVVICMGEGAGYEVLDRCEEGVEGCEDGECVPLGMLSVSIISVVIPPGLLESQYQFSLEATGGRAPYRWSIIEGVLPGGVVLTEEGTLSGSPTEEGVFGFQVKVKDDSTPAKTAQAELSLVVLGEALEVVTASLETGTVGEFYDVTLEASGGMLPYRWGVGTGELPEGLFVSPEGVLSGVPVSAGQFDVTLRLRDALDVMASTDVSLVIEEAQNQDAGHYIITKTFEDISITGRRLEISEASDALTAAEPIGFGFEFYGQLYGHLFVSTEGYVSFESSSVASENVAIPSTGGPGAFIAVFWDDLDPALHGDIFIDVRGVSPYRRLVVQWRDVAHAERPESRINAQIILYETTNQVQLLYGVSSNGPGASGEEVALGERATVGVENSGGTLGEGLHHETPSLEPGQVWMLTPTGAIYTRESWTRVVGAFDDISGSGLPLLLALTDDSEANTLIGFDFEFFGVSYSSMRVSSNGFVTFGEEGATQAENDLLGTVAAPNAVIAPYWDDLEPEFFAPFFQVLGDAPRRRAVVQWSGFRRSEGTLTFQLILHETSHVIAMHYGNMTSQDEATANGQSATIGIEDASGTTSVLLSGNTSSVSTGDSAYFIPSSSESTGYLGVGLSSTYEDIRSQGEELPFPLFTSSWEVATGFNLVFFGESRSTVTVTKFGQLLLGRGSDDVSGDNQTIPLESGPNGYLAPFWDNLTHDALTGAVTVLRRGEVGSRELLVQWDDMRHPNDFTMLVSFQVVLRESDGRAEFRYGAMKPGQSLRAFGSSATIGVEADDGAGGALHASGEAGSVISGTELIIIPR